MANDREKISTGPKESPVNETIAGTGPGIPDEALAPGEQMLEPPTDEEVARVAARLGVNKKSSAGDEKDTLPLDGE